MKQTPPTASIEIAEIDDRRALRESDDDVEPLEAPCPKCGYQQPPEFTARPRSHGPQPLNICISCGEFMTWDPALDDAEERFNPRHTPTPVPTSNDDFRRFSPKTCRQLLESQSITHRLARMRGYKLGKIMRGGSA